MKSIHKIIFSTALLAATGAAAGVELWVNTMNDRELPVLVQVNSKGKVTRVLPAVPLSPALTRSLRDTISHWVIGPAIGKNKRPTSSHIIMRVALFVEPLNNGRYDASFHYISRQDVAFANSASFWHWEGKKLALVSTPDFIHNSIGPGMPQQSVDSAIDISGIAAVGQPGAHFGSSAPSGGGGHGGGKH